MEEKRRFCWNCLRYKAFYTKGFCHFNKEENGYCIIHKKILDKNEQCEDWIRNKSRQEKRKVVAMRKLNEILNMIVEIKQILFEAKEESEPESN